MMTVYHISRVVGTKNFKNNMTKLKDAVDKCEEIGELFAYFT